MLCIDKTRQDITKYSTSEKYDGIIMGSSCTNFSRAGKSNGGAKGSNTQSALIWEGVRIVKEVKPKFVILENVTDILNKTHRSTFDEYLQDMADLGYATEYAVINSFGFNSPQTRKRLFAIHVLEENKFDFNNIINPMRGMNSLEFVEKKEHKYIGESLKEKYGDFVFTSSKTAKLGFFGKDYQDKRVYLLGAELPTITASNWYKVNDGIGIRELTSWEMWKMQGFKEEYYKRAAVVTSENALKRQAGNSINVEILREIIKELERTLYKEQ